MGYLDNAGLQYFYSKLKDKFAPKSHTHDDRYYTESEIDTKLAGKSNTNHTHDASTLINNLSSGTSVPTDPDYILTQYVGGGTSNMTWVRRPLSSLWEYIKNKTDTLYQAKGSYAASNHNHNSLYYQKSEINTKLAAKAESITLATNADLNKIVTPGMYSCGGGNSIANKPSNVDAIGLIVTHNASGSYYTQILTTSSNANTYRRTCLNGTWSAWTQDKYTDTNTWRGIQNNLTSDSTTDSLSAAQGKALKALVDEKAASNHTHKSVIDNGNSSSATTFAYSKAGMNYGDYTWLAAWNGYELRAVNKSQFAQANHDHTKLSPFIKTTGQVTSSNSWFRVARFNLGTINTAYNGTTDMWANWKQLRASFLLEGRYVKSGIVNVLADTTGNISATGQTDKKAYYAKNRISVKLNCYGVDPSYVEAKAAISNDNHVYVDFWVRHGEYNTTSVYCLGRSDEGSISLITSFSVSTAITTPDHTYYTCGYSKTSYGDTVSTQNILPASNNAYSIGTSSNKWNNIYATTFTGNLSGTASTASKLSTSAGSGTQPVYFKDGVPVATTYTLGKSVPSDAKFTDTNTWRGVQNNLTSTATDQSLSAAMGKKLNEEKAPASGSNNYVRVWNSGTVGGTDNASLNDLAKQHFAMAMVNNATDNPTGGKNWVHAISMNWTNGSNAAWVSQIALGVAASNGMWYRTTGGNVVGAAWKRVLDSSNYTDYAASKSHTHNYAGSSSAGGSATSAVKLDSSAGSATQPVYFSGGKPAACTYTLGKSVPSDAKFTDTTYGVATASANGLMSSTDKTKLDDFGKVVSIQKSIKLTTDWQDTGITGTNLETGTYVIQVSGFNSSYTQLYSEIYSGTMSWFAGQTNSTNSSEIFLHNAGHADNSNALYLRTIRSASNGYLKLQVAVKTAATGTDTLTFKFRRLI